MHAVQVCRCTNQFYLYSRHWFTLSVACMKSYLSQLDHSSAAVSKWCAVVLYNNTVVSPLVASYVDRAARDVGTVADIYGSLQESREIFDPIFSVQVRAYSSRKSWGLQFHNSELYFRNRPGVFKKIIIICAKPGENTSKFDKRKSSQCVVWMEARVSDDCTSYE